MPISLRNYTHNTQLSATATVLITVVPSNTKAVVKKLSFYNSGTVNRLVKLYVVPSSGSIATTNLEVEKSIAPKQTWDVITILNEVLETGMTLQATVDAGTDVNANCSGADIT